MITLRNYFLALEYLYINGRKGTIRIAALARHLGESDYITGRLLDEMIELGFAGGNGHYYFITRLGERVYELAIQKNKCLDGKPLYEKHAE